MYIDISVVIPVYNPPHDKFERCIGSLVSQAGELCYEFIFVNDGSTDTWIAERLERLEKDDCRVVVITKENEGVSVARNTGMEKARGEYIAFCDADDIYEKNAFEYMFQVVMEQNADAAVFGTIRENFNHEKEAASVVDCQTKRDMLLSILSYRTAIYSQKGLIIDSTWAKLFRHEIIIKHELRFDKTLCVSEDALFCAEFYEYAETIVLDNRQVYQFIANEDSLTRKYKKEYNEMIPRLIKKEIDFIGRYHQGDAAFEETVAIRTFVALTHADHCYFIPRMKEKGIASELRELWNDRTIHVAVKRNTFALLKANAFGSANYYMRLLIYKYKMVHIYTLIAKAILAFKKNKEQLTQHNQQIPDCDC